MRRFVSFRGTWVVTPRTSWSCLAFEFHSTFFTTFLPSILGAMRRKLTFLLLALVPGCGHAPVVGRASPAPARQPAHRPVTVQVFDKKPPNIVKELGPGL